MVPEATEHVRPAHSDPHDSPATHVQLRAEFFDQCVRNGTSVRFGRRGHRANMCCSSTGRVARLLSATVRTDISLKQLVDGFFSKLVKEVVLCPGPAQLLRDQGKQLVNNHVDFVFYADDLSAEEINRHMDSSVQMLDSGYIRHLMQSGISKGETLQKIVSDSDFDCDYSGVMVVGDSATDISLFERFDLSVLVFNPNLPADQTRHLDTLCRYRSTLSFADGFVQVARHIVKMRESSF